MITLDEIKAMTKRARSSHHSEKKRSVRASVMDSVFVASEPGRRKYPAI